MKTLSKKALASKMMAVFGCCILVMGLSACSDDDKSLGQTTISVTSFSPESGLPGTEVTISGSNFGDEAKVFFNEAEATDYVSRSSTSIVVRVPENASTGRIGVLSGKNDYGFSATEFRFIQGAVIERLSMTSAPVGSTLTITGHNFFDLDLSDITVWFGSASSKALAATSTEVTTTVPEGAEDGPIAIQFGSIQKVYGPEFTVGAIVNALQDYYFSHNDVVMTSGKSNPCSYSDVNGGGVCFYDKGVYADGYNSNSEVKSFTIWDSNNGDAIMFMVNLDAEDDYYLYFGTKGKVTGNITISAGSDRNSFTQSITNECSANGYGWPTTQYEFGSYHLAAGVNYIRIDFGTGLALTDLHITNKRLTGDDIIPGKEAIKGLFAHDFNDNTLGCFKTSWSWDPSYAKAVNQYMEVYFNQAALDADNRRERRGAEVACDFTTNSEGWYGFKIFLPDGLFPKNIDGSVIAQIFNSGNSNTWAGHVKINHDKLVMSYRGSAAASAEVNKEVGTLTWDKWTPIVVYFRAGRNRQGNIKVWMGDNITEDNPTFDSGGINFAFGEWIDDTHLNNVARDDYKAASLGPKFGLYVSTGGDRTIRFDDLKALEGNPTGAFGIVKP